MDHRSKIPGYDQTTWFSNKAISNIVSLKNITKQYRVTYDRNDETLSVHRKESGLTNLELRMN